LAQDISILTKVGISMSESHVVSGLVAKRAETTGQIEACQAEFSNSRNSNTQKWAAYVSGSALQQ
jgi:hypothetical protein